MHGEICRQIKLRERYTREAVFDICKNDNPNFSVKIIRTKVYVEQNYPGHNIYDSTEGLINRLEQTDFSLQQGDIVYNYLLEDKPTLSQYLVIERRVGYLIQRIIVNNDQAIPTLVRMKTIDPAEDNFFVFFSRHCFPCCFKKPSVFDQENIYEAIDNSE